MLCAITFQVAVSVLSCHRKDCLFRIQAGSRNWIPVITAGANWFFYGHRLKITPEIIYLPKGIPIDDGASDVLTTNPGKGEIVGEVQLQLLI